MKKESGIELSNKDSIGSMQETVKNQAYVKPVLVCFGDVRDVTLGGSIPGLESNGTCIPGIGNPACT